MVEHYFESLRIIILLGEWGDEEGIKVAEGVRQFIYNLDTLEEGSGN